MGQQQLLLVILVTIIVGIATVVAINTFGSAADNASIDGARQDIAQIGASAQAYYMRPAMMGGGDRDFSAIDFSEISFGADSLTNSDLTAHNTYGDYVISARSADTFVVTATIPVDTDDDNSDDTIAALVCADDIAIADVNAATPGSC